MSEASIKAYKKRNDRKIFPKPGPFCGIECTKVYRHRQCKKQDTKPGNLPRHLFKEE